MIFNCKYTKKFELPNMKKKILLINVPTFNLEKFNKEHNKIKGYSLYPPVQLTSIAASVLKKVDSTEIKILDLIYEITKYFKDNSEPTMSPKNVMEKIVNDFVEKFQPDLCGISITFSPGHDNAITIANLIKKKNKKILVVCGGNHSTFAYKRILEECSNMDFVFLYEADNTFPLFIKYMKDEIVFKDLKGIAWFNKKNNKVEMSPYDKLIHDLDKIPIPNWDLIPIKQYQNYGRVGGMQRCGDENLPSYVMQTVRGCVASCSFCSVRSFYGKGVRALSAKRVLEEIDYLYNELGIKQLEMLDDDFTFDRKRTLEICNGLIKRNYDLIWAMSNGVRLGTLNEEVVHALVGAKCRVISVGVESGNDSTLAIVRKPLSVKMLYRKSEIFQKYPDLYVMGNYMVGFPFENDELMYNTFKVAEDIGYDWSKFFVFQPLPGTPEFQKLDKKSQDSFDFSAIRYDKSHKEARDLKSEIENQMQESLAKTHEAQNRGVPNTNSNETDYSQISYLKNLEVNFIRNKNLNGKNVDRAIKDYEGILKFIEKDHTIAHFCLAKAYLSKKKPEIAKKHIAKIDEIHSNPANKKWLEYFNKIVPEVEFKKINSQFTNYTTI